MKIMNCVGTRACAIKMAPIIRECLKREHETLVVYSGQHYSPNLYENVFGDLEIPRPNYDIRARGSPLEMGARILTETKNILEKEKPDIMLVHGDTYSALFYALAGAISLVPVGHVEAGLRTYSWEPFPEQICTKTADACSSIFFTPTEKNRKDLLGEHVPDDRIFVVGNSVVDACLQHKKMAMKKSNILERFKLKKPLVFWSCHRKENLLHEERMKGIFDSLLEMENVTFFCSVLPSTRMAAEKYGYAEKLKSAPHIYWEPCLPRYTNSLRIMLESDLILTDSGGIVEESATLNIPCLILRYVSDRQEAVDAGAAKCVGCEKEKVVKEVRNLLENKEEAEKMRKAPNPYGDGKTSERILNIIERLKGRMERWEKGIVGHERKRVEGEGD